MPGRIHAADRPAFIEAFPNAIVNIHPSLLPAFPGLRAAQALAHGVKVSGVTVHLVTAELDAGPDHRAARGADARERHRRQPRGAHPRRGAPGLPRGGPARLDGVEGRAAWSTGLKP